jgi:hypothetical protein
MRSSLTVDQFRFNLYRLSNIKMAVFWVVAPCCLVEVYQLFRGLCCLHYHRAITQKTAIFIHAAVRTSNPTQIIEHFLRVTKLSSRHNKVHKFRLTNISNTQGLIQIRTFEYILTCRTDYTRVLLRRKTDLFTHTYLQ